MPPDAADMREFELRVVSASPSPSGAVVVADLIEPYFGVVRLGDLIEASTPGGLRQGQIEDFLAREPRPLDWPRNRIRFQVSGLSSGDFRVGSVLVGAPLVPLDPSPTSIRLMAEYGCGKSIVVCR
jgi:hypothetical protein